MIKLKGQKDSEAQRVMTKALGGGKQGTQLARNLGLPSAVGGASGGASGAAAGPAPSIRGKTEQCNHKEDEDEDAGKTQEDEEEEVDEDDDVMAAYREQRLAQLKREHERAAEFRAMGHGEYREVGEEDFLPAVTKSKYVVCQFYHAAFERCKIFDMHLALLAKKYLPTRFIKLNAEKAPFFVGKLQVKVLPTLVLFKDGIAVDRVVGFEELGGVDDFATSVLERRIAKSGVVADTGKAGDGGGDGEATKPQNSIRKSDMSKGLDSDDESDPSSEDEGA